MREDVPLGIAIIALAVAAGCKGPHAIAEFAESLNHAQRGRLRCRPRRGRPREHDVPCERTFRRLLKKVDSQQLKGVLTGWMEAEDPAPLQVMHVDGKVVKNAQPAPPRSHWSIENGQHYRRDRTQDEDRCPVRETTTARNLSLFRALAIFLLKRQSRGRGGKKTLPDFERHVHRKPWGLIRRFTQRRHEE